MPRGGKKSLHPRRLLFSLTGLFVCGGMGGCHYYMPDPPCPPPPSTRSPNTLTFSLVEPTVSPVIPAEDQWLALADLVDIALQNSPQTRAAWYSAKQAAAAVGTARGAYLPSILLTGFWVKQTIALSSPIVQTPGVTKGALLSTNYLLFDFGGRNSNLQAAVSALDSLQWTVNWEAQTVMVGVIQSYYNYTYAQEIVAVCQAHVSDYETTVAAATALRQQGVRGLSDELQARTALLQARIALQHAESSYGIAKATLAYALGLPADTPLSIASLPSHIETQGVGADVTLLFQAAKENRADLMALRSTVLQNRFAVTAARSALMPTLSAGVEGGKISVNNFGYINSYSLGCNLNIPLFSSFASINAYRSAQAALLQAQAQLDAQELSAFLSLMSDFYEWIANREILNYSEEALALATKNREVAFANYQAGITTILDLMTADNALNTARQQLAEAKTAFLTSLANLAYNSGGLHVEDFVPVPETQQDCLSPVCSVETEPLSADFLPPQL